MNIRFFYFCFIAVLTVSCAKEQRDSIQIKNEEPVFHATIENIEAQDTRVYADEQLRVLWNTDDRVSIFNKTTYNCQYRFDGQDGDNFGSFSKVPSEDFVMSNPLDYVYAVYPYNESTAISDDGVITVFLPSVQPFREGSFGQGANTMISVTEDNELMFKNLCGYFAVRLYGDNVKVTSIKLTGKNNEHLAGKAYATADLDAAPTLQFDESSASGDITLSFATPIVLGTTAETATVFWFVVPPTVFEHGFTLTVKDDKNCVFEKSATKPLEIRRNTRKKTTALKVVMLPDEGTVGEAIDLGLSVEWASWNVGASAPEEYGDYFAWAEIEPYYEPGYGGATAPIWREGKSSGYSWASYRWCNGTYDSQIKYCPKDKVTYWDGIGDPDGLTTILPEDDVALVKWGGNWRIPTLEDIQELLENCTAIWTTQNGVNGCLFTSKKSGFTDKSVFLPAVGDRYEDYISNPGTYGAYWSSDLYTVQPNGAYSLRLEESGASIKDYGHRFRGFAIRPVLITSISSIELHSSPLSIIVGEVATLTVTILPDNASRKSIVWSSSDNSVATVDSQGIVTAVAEGTTIVTAMASDGSGVSASCLVTVHGSSGPLSETVDLGLSVKWSSTNLGAAKPEDYGDYIAWGETEPYYKEGHAQSTTGNYNNIYKPGKVSGYTWASYKWCNGSNYNLTKYCTDPDFGVVDNKTILDMEDDAAHAVLGGDWRMPTLTEIEELFDTNRCSWVRSTLNGVSGYRVTSKKDGYSDKSIFFPAAGYRFEQSSIIGKGSICYYWSSSLDPDHPTAAHSLDISNDAQIIGWHSRCNGSTIRPVCP